MNRRFMDHAATLLVVVLMTTFGATPAQPQTLEELRAKYPWGALYVSTSSLVDFSYILESSHGDASEHQSALPALAAFIRQVGGSQISRNIAILHLDIRELRAGYTAPGNSMGLLTPLPWSQTQVCEVARWLDRYFSTNAQHTLRMTGLEQVGPGRPNERLIGDALRGVMEAFNDPFVSPVRRLQFATEFRAWLATNQAELASFERANHRLHQELLRFQTEFDREFFSRDLQEIRPGLLEQQFDVRQLDRMWTPPLEMGPQLQHDLRVLERSLDRVNPQ